MRPPGRGSMHNMVNFDEIPEPLKWVALSVALFISGFITRAFGWWWEAKEKRKNWMKPRPKTWAETLEEAKEERRQRNAQALQLSDEELEKLRPKGKPAGSAKEDNTG